jgi:ribosomal-protein-alanine N-acetyltransferase
LHTHHDATEKLVTIRECPRLRLVQFAEVHAPFVLQLLTDTDFLRNIGDRGVHTLEEARNYIATGPRASYQQYGFGLYLVELKQPQQPIGMCGLLRRDWHPDVELGFAFLPAGRGKGYATEAAQATLDFGRRALSLRRFVAVTTLDNHASIRVLEKQGFRFEREIARASHDRPSKFFVLDDSATQP